MAEQLELAVPVVPPPSGPTISTYAVTGMDLDWVNHVLDIRVTDNNGTVTTFHYTGAAGDTLLHAINTGNFSGVSLERAALLYLVSDGHLPAGTVTGTPT